MLSAFTARLVYELKPRDKAKIESILTYGDRLLVGLSTGSLRIYRVNEIVSEPEQNGTSKEEARPRNGASTATKPVDLLRELEKFSPKAVEQLARIKEANVLISLSNAIVSVHDLQSYSLQEQLSKSKNASVFAVTSNIVKDSTGIPEIISRLAVAVKRKIIFWSWHESELSSDVTEITLPAAARTLTWASATKLICGMNSGYMVVDVTSHEIKDIVGPGAIGGTVGAEGSRFGGVGSASMGYMGLGGYIPRPLITRLQDGEMLLAKDINSLFINSEGEPLEKRQVPWQQSPESIGYSYPYMISLQKGALEIRNPDTLSLLQTVSIPNVTQLHFPPPNVSLPHAGKGFHAISERGVWRMGTTDYDSQINELTQASRYDEAISILNMLEDALLRDKEGRIREIKMLKAQTLFDQRKYREALDLFTEVRAPPARVISMYPRIIAGECSVFQDTDETNDDTPSENGTEADVKETKTYKSNEHSHAILGKFMKQHKKSQSLDSGSMRSTKDVGESSDAASMRQKQEDLPLHGKDLVNAVLELNGFLVNLRTQLQRFLNPATEFLRLPSDEAAKEVFESLINALSLSRDDPELEPKLKATSVLVDTTLFRSYMFARPSLAGSLFRIPNFCDPEVVNEKLLENGRYNDLVDFFHGKGLHRQALELLQEFGQSDDSEESMRGPQRTVGYLQNLSSRLVDLTLEFAVWPLKANPDLGMQIFLADTENAETLPRDKVVAFLENIDMDLTNDYLEHIIHDLDDFTPEFHNKLVKTYVTELQEKNLPRWQEKMEKMIRLLRTSGQYSLSMAFSMIPKDDSDFYEAQAVVLSNMDQHKQALEVYVFKLKDFDKAEEYCNRIHLLQDSPIDLAHPRKASTSELDDSSSSIYHTLLSLYLEPPAPYEPNYPPALSLLSKHGSRLPAASTLNLVPSSLAVADLESYFQGRIRAANSIINEARVVVGLRKSEVVSTQAALLLGEGVPSGKGGRNRRVVVDDERVCGVCHKRLGRSVVAVLPNNTVIHYGCLNRAQSNTTRR